MIVGMNTQYWFGKIDCHASGVMAVSSIARNAIAVINRDLYLYVVVIVDTIQDKKNFLLFFIKKRVDNHSADLHCTFSGLGWLLHKLRGDLIFLHAYRFFSNF